MPVNRKKLLPLSKVQGSTTLSLVGVWANELGSTMTIRSFDGQTFSGTYQSAVSEAGTSVTGPLAGTVSGDAITFTVNWGAALSSVTAWTGLLMGGDRNLVIYGAVAARLDTGAERELLAVDQRRSRPFRPAGQRVTQTS